MAHSENSAPTQTALQHPSRLLMDLLVGHLGRSTYLVDVGDCAASVHITRLSIVSKYGILKNRIQEIKEKKGEKRIQIKCTKC